MTEVRITKRDNYKALAVGVAQSGDLSDDTVDRLQTFIAHELELLDRKRGSKSAPTKTQVANIEIKEDIATTLSDNGEGMRATDIANFLDLSVQKISALLRQMVADGSVARIQDGKAVTFAPAEEDWSRTADE